MSGKLLLLAIFAVSACVGSAFITPNIEDDPVAFIRKLSENFTKTLNSDMPFEYSAISSIAAPDSNIQSDYKIATLNDKTTTEQRAFYTVIQTAILNQLQTIEQFRVTLPQLVVKIVEYFTDKKIQQYEKKLAANCTQYTEFPSDVRQEMMECPKPYLDDAIRIVTQSVEYITKDISEYVDTVRGRWESCVNGDTDISCLMDLSVDVGYNGTVMYNNLAWNTFYQDPEYPEKVNIKIAKCLSEKYNKFVTDHCSVQ